MHREEHEPEPVIRELETGLDIRRFEREPGVHLVATIVVRPVRLESGEPADLAFHACCQDQIEHPVNALELEGFEITARYDGRRFSDAHHGYRLLHGTIDSPRAQVMARRLRQIDYVFAASGRGTPSEHDYPELVVTIAEIIEARFIRHHLDPDPAASLIATGIPGLAAAFERYTPRNSTGEPPSF